LAIIQSSLNNVNENTYAIITFFENNFLKLWLFEEQEKVEIPSEVQELAQKRREAKKNKDWNTADSLRDQLTSLWWKILDRPDGFDLEKI
jgi:cysteinyl-tRNA synthetase